MEIRICKSHHHSTKHTVRIELSDRSAGHSISETTPKIADNLLKAVGLGKIEVTIMKDVK